MSADTHIDRLVHRAVARGANVPRLCVFMDALIYLVEKAIDDGSTDTEYLKSMKAYMKSLGRNDASEMPGTLAGLRAVRERLARHWDSLR